MQGRENCDGLASQCLGVVSEAIACESVYDGALKSDKMLMEGP